MLSGGTSGRAPTALIAVRGTGALACARAFADQGFVPNLAFTAQQLLHFAPSADVAIADDDLDPDAESLRLAARGSRMICVFVRDADLPVPRGVHAMVPPGSPPAQIADLARSLFQLRGPRAADDVTSFGGLHLDPARREARWLGLVLDLTHTQFDILRALVRAGGAVVTKPDLQRAVWPDAEPDDGERLVAHIRRIRTRIEADPSRPRFLVTVRGVGFRLAEPQASEGAAHLAPVRSIIG